MSAVMEKEAVVIPQSNFSKLPEPVRALVNSQPLNPITWGVLRKSCNIQVPQKFNGSASELIQYIDALDPSVLKAKGSGVSKPTTQTTRVTNNRERREVSLGFNVFRSEYGTARFSCTAYGRASVTIDEHEILRELQDRNWDIEATVEALRDSAESDCWDDVDWHETGDYDYDDYDTTDSDNDEIDDVEGVRDLRQLVTTIYSEYEDQEEEEDSDEDE